MKGTLHEGYFTWRVLYTKGTLHEGYFTRRLLYMKGTLHKGYFTWRVLYTKGTLHEGYFTRRLLYMKGTLHEGYFTWRVLYMKTNIQLWSYLAKFFLEREIFQTKVIEKIEIHIFLITLFFENRAVYEMMWNNIAELNRPQMTIWFMRRTYWMPRATNTPSDCDIYCFSNARTRLNVTLYVHCLSCYFLEACWWGNLHAGRHALYISQNAMETRITYTSLARTLLKWQLLGRAQRFLTPAHQFYRHLNSGNFKVSFACLALSGCFAFFFLPESIHMCCWFCLRFISGRYHFSIFH